MLVLSGGSGGLRRPEMELSGLAAMQQNASDGVPVVQGLLTKQVRKNLL
jgi:hypothetical protein